MKKIYFFLLMLLVITCAWGQVLTENFSYTAGTLLTANGWTAHSGAGTNAITVTSPGLTYAGHPGSGVGNATTIAAVTGEDDNKTLSSAITSGSAYASFLINVTSAQAAGDYVAGLLSSGTVFPIRIYIKSSGAGFVFGIGKQAGTATYEATVRNFGTTYFVATNYIYNVAAQDDAVNLWVNPSLGGSEPAGTIANVTFANADATTLTAFYVRQGTAASMPGAQVDAILAGTTWASVTPLAGGTTATLANLIPQSSGSITQGTNNAVLAGFSITPTASVDFTAITVTSTGTATSTDISNVRIFKDNDANGAINGADAAVGGAAAQAYSASMVFTGITGETGLVAQTNYLVVADIAGVGVSTPGVTTTVSSNTFTTTATSNAGSFAGNSRTIAAPPGASTITAGAGAEPATISSLINTQGAAVLNFDFTIQDDGATPATDGAATQISQIVLNAGTGNTVTNWNTAILGVELSDGTNSTTTATIGTSSITFTGITNTVGTLGHIADDASKTYTLKIWLKTNLGAFRTTIDGQNFVFRIQTADVTVAGSQLATGQDVNSGSTNNVVDVTATVLAFVTQPANTTVNAAMANVTVSANDANGNRDLGSTVSVAITSTGTLTGSPVTIAAVSGLATFAGLTHTATGTGLTLNAERSGTLDWDVASNTFNISSAALAAWDFFGNNAANATVVATTFNANLVSTSGANNITRGAGAAASAATNSFRTTGFQNDPISTSNTDYFQVTLTAQPGFELSLSSIDGFVNGTATFAAAPGVSNQFAYSLDGVNFTLIGSPIVTGTPLPATLSTVDLTGISALQNISAGTTITIRYYASGQTTTGGWGFFSSASGVNGLAFGGSVVVSTTPNLTVSSGSLTFPSQAVGSNSTSQNIDLSGVNLTGAPGDVTVTAPSTDFQVSNDNSSWGASTLIHYTSATLTATAVYIRFTPQGPGPKSGNVSFSGGGDATPPSVAVSGSGVINYYSKSSGSLANVATWGTAGDGTGSSPSDFTTAGQTFTISNTASVTLDANWTVSGANSKVVVGNGSGIDFTIPSGFALTGTVDVANLGYLHIQNSTVPTIGTLATGSSIEFAQAGTYVVPARTYHNLRLMNGTKTLATGTTTVNGALNVDGVTGFNGAGSPFSTLDLAGGYFQLENGATFDPNPTGDGNRITVIASASLTTFTGGNFELFRIQTPATPVAAHIIQISGNGAGHSLFLGNLAGGGLNLQQSTDELWLLPTSTLTIRGAGFFSSTNLGTIHGTGTSNLVIDKTSGATAVGSIGFTAGAATLNNLTVNSAGTGNNNFTILGSVLQTNNLTLTSGRIVIPTGTQLELMTTNLTGTGFGASKHIVTSVNTTTGAKGTFRVDGITTAFTFPVGDGTNYLPVTVTPSSSNDFTVCAFPGITDNGEPNGIPFTATQKDDVVDAVWQVGRFSATGDATLMTSWPTSLEGASFSTYADNQIGIAHNNGSAWGTVVGTGDNTGNTATRTGITTFSPFGVGLVGQILPVNFSNIKATQVSGGIKVDWSNMTELEVVNYGIERSGDGRNFISIGTVNARLNNGGKADYSFVDASPFNGVNYYRIRSLESTGKNKYSIIVKVDIRGGATVLSLYPNPVVDGQLSYQAMNLVKGQYTLRIFNNVGQQVYSKTLNHPGGSITEAITLPSVRAGVYSLQLISDENNFVKTFVVK